MKRLDSEVSLFLWSFSQFTILQIVKTGNGLFAAGPELSMTLLLWTVLVVSASFVLLVNANSRKAAGMMLMSFAVLTVIDGSLSNHVVTACSLAILAILCPKLDQLLGGGKWFCAVLYLVTGLHKLNSGFFDPHHSCASLYMAGSLALLPDWLVQAHKPFLGLIVSASPYCAVAFELVWPFLLILSSGSMYRLTVLIGCLFHAVLALPPSPLSVYPFSAIMVPLYAILSPNRSALLSAVNRVADSRLIGPTLICLLAISGRSSSFLFLNVEDLFEYPNYRLWGVSIAWNCVWWTLLIYSCTVSRSIPARSSLPKRAALIIGFLFLFAMTPYVGLRNYPALAMFSNLRTEGTRPNHLLPSIDLFGYQKDYVTVTATNFKPIQDLQVNLGQLFPDKLTSAAKTFNLSTEFYICPPKWTHKTNQVDFRPFSVPFIELRRKMSMQSRPSEHRFIEYIRFKTESAPTFHRVDGNSSDTFEELFRPLSFFEKYFVRFRSYNDDYSPCRH